MDIYSSYDYMCNEPFLIPNIGRIKCPTLRDIRKVNYNFFMGYRSVALLDLNEYLKTRKLEDAYFKLSDEEREKNNLFNLYLYLETDFLSNAIQLFFYDIPKLDTETSSFIIYDRDNPNVVVGNLNSDNFDLFREEVKIVLGYKKSNEKKLKFKNKRAEELYYMIEKHKQEQAKNVDENLEFENIIAKYCTYNKVGINILNVWDLTYYQFNRMFAEFQISRHIEHADRVAANTFTYSKASDYKPMEYMKKIK